jgi:hypothetical protein
MFFAKRRSGLRVTEKMGLDPRSPEATELVEMIIAGAKQYERMSPAIQAKVSDLEKALWAAAALTDNASAYARLERELRVTGKEVDDLMLRVRRAGRDLAIEEGLNSVAERFYDRLRPVGQVAGRG